MAYAFALYVGNTHSAKGPGLLECVILCTLASVKKLDLAICLTNVDNDGHNFGFSLAAHLGWCCGAGGGHRLALPRGGRPQ